MEHAHFALVSVAWSSEVCGDMERWRGRVALVTGASAGIGYETTKQLALAGMTVVGCARNTAKIDALSADLGANGRGKVVSVRCDVRKEQEVVAMFERAVREFGGVDVMISNAGLAHSEPLLTGDTSQWREMMEVNVIGLCVCNREFMKQARDREMDDGHIILLNSMSGHRVVNSGSTHFYCATKYAVTAITEGLRQELREIKSGIRVTGISPGLVRTEFGPRLDKVTDIEQGMKDYDSKVDGPLEAEDIAGAIVYAISTPPRVQIHDILVRPTHQLY